MNSYDFYRETLFRLIKIF